MNEERQVKGIWIPIEIWDNPELSMMAKILWAEINSLDNEKKGGCFASNEFFMKRLGIKITRLKELLKELKDLKLIEVVSFNGRQRILRSCCSAASRRPEKRPPEVRKSGPLPLETYIQDESTVENTYSSCRQAKQVSPSLDASRLANLFISKIQEFDPKFKRSADQKLKWAQEIDKMHRLDERPWDQIESLIHFVTNDNFWRGNVLSPKKLREKATSLIGKMKNNPKGSRANLGGSANQEYENAW